MKSVVSVRLCTITLTTILWPRKLTISGIAASAASPAASAATDPHSTARYSAPCSPRSPPMSPISPSASSSASWDDSSGSMSGSSTSTVGLDVGGVLVEVRLQVGIHRLDQVLEQQRADLDPDRQPGQTEPEAQVRSEVGRGVVGLDGRDADHRRRITGLGGDVAVTGRRLAVEGPHPHLQVAVRRHLDRVAVRIDPVGPHVLPLPDLVGHPAPVVRGLVHPVEVGLGGVAPLLSGGDGGGEGVGVDVRRGRARGDRGQYEADGLGGVRIGHGGSWIRVRRG